MNMDLPLIILIDLIAMAVLAIAGIIYNMVIDRVFRTAAYDIFSILFSALFIIVAVKLIGL